jgi:transposase
MQPRHIIALDTHCAFTQVAILTEAGRVVREARVATSVAALRQLVEAVKRPRHVVLEEGPLADWLLRELRPCADAVVACDPRRNAHIAKDGDKDDPIDAPKLGQLYRGNFVRPVHHPETLERAAFKQFVGLYHDRVRNAVRHANRIRAQFRRHGLFCRRRELLDPAPRSALLRRVPVKFLRAGVLVLLDEFDLALDRLERLRRRLAREARGLEPVRRFVAVPGVKWVRAATFFAYVDTPWRFRSKQALWRYMGIGLQRRHSGQGTVAVSVPPGVEVCRPLKGMILGAAKSALAGENPFAERYKEWRHAGVTPRNARRNVARSQAATLWGMWKNGSVFRPEWIGVALAGAAERTRSQADG